MFPVKHVHGDSHADKKTSKKRHEDHDLNMKLKCEWHTVHLLKSRA